jgi:hypothetical protein
MTYCKLQTANTHYLQSSILNLRFPSGHFDPEKATIGLLTAVLVILAVQTARGPVQHGKVGDIAEDGDPCTGEPIAVDYPYDNRMLEPHACKIQCSDQKPRYILYKNHIATQCETPPGCNDWGEDRRVTCIPPATTTDAMGAE